MRKKTDFKSDELIEKAARFAERAIAVRADDLHKPGKFPVDLWAEMGKEKLLGMGIPEIYGGLGQNYPAISMAGEALVRYGGNLGIVMSMFMQNLAARYLISGFGSALQKDDILPRMVCGDLTVSFAVSEPGKGAHPKHLATLATPEGQGYVISGSKTYLTNGPIANLFVVVAVTGYDNGKKRYSAFVIPKEAPGLSVQAPMVLDALHPSPHGGITLESCYAPGNAILGNAHTAYGDMVKPFREVEDVLMMGPLTGGAGYLWDRAVDLLKNRKVDIDGEQKAVLGKIHALIRVLRQIAGLSAEILDTGAPDFSSRAMIIAFRSIFTQIRELFHTVTSGCDITGEGVLAAMIRDLDFSAKMAVNAAKAREIQYGEEIMKRKGT
jgi:alkylation response protein AidB-like acyl-CoA dehydrogenase